MLQDGKTLMIKLMFYTQKEASYWRKAQRAMLQSLRLFPSQEKVGDNPYGDINRNKPD